ncbi:MAG TPA: alpha/beta hydrolase [Pseudonocardiaceae bacterium]|nr:alpha/beta hydrolase [Pseudonocardiaceae bacterium]
MSLPTVMPETTSVDAGAVRLGVRRWSGAAGRPVLLVHGLSSNARLWDLVAARLAEAGHPVLAVDLRGHGSSARVADAGVADGSTDPTRTAAADLAALCSRTPEGWTESTPEGWTAPVVAGQSWGGNVVLQLAADRPDLVHGLVLVDGGWLHLGNRFDDLEAAWQVLAPPRLTGLPVARLRERLAQVHPHWSPEAVDATLANFEQLADGTVRPWLSRERHHAVVASLLAHQPRELYRRVRCRCILLAATSTDGSRTELADEAVRSLPDVSRLEEFPGGDHDLHAQHPNRVAEAIGELT